MDKYLILNADDFGYNEQQSKAIAELYEKGLITSTSLMAVAPDVLNAAKTAVSAGIPVGVHLTINSDDENNRWNGLAAAPSLSDEKGLYHDGKKLALHAKRKDVRAELEAQYHFLTENGCTVDHADNHCATLYGINGRRFYLDAYDFCARHNLPYRFPKKPDFLARQLGRAVPKPLIALQQGIVNAGLRRGVKLLDDLVSNPWNIERIGNYETLRQYYLDAVDACGEGVTEMFLHPAYPIDDKKSEWTKRVFEFELLKSGDLLERAEKNHIKVVSWSIFRELNE